MKNEKLYQGAIRRERERCFAALWAEIERCAEFGMYPGKMDFRIALGLEDNEEERDMQNGKIWKYPVPLNADEFTVAMPVGARVLDVQTQHGQPVIWAMVDADRSQEFETRFFEIYGTGMSVPDPESLNYVGTFQMRGGHLIIHLFENLDKSL